MKYLLNMYCLPCNFVNRHVQSICNCIKLCASVVVNIMELWNLPPAYIPNFVWPKWAVNAFYLPQVYAVFSPEIAYNYRSQSCNLFTFKDFYVLIYS